MNDIRLKRGGVYIANLPYLGGQIQYGERPVLVIQNNRGNNCSPTVIIAPITSSATKAELPTHVEFQHIHKGIQRTSTVLLEQIQTINKANIKHKIAELSYDEVHKINEAIKISLAIPH